MKILVTGLCLSRNLGGPAMGLTLIDQVKKKYPESKFIFAVEPHEYEIEKKWADIYNIEIVRRDKLTSYITTKLKLREILNFTKFKFKKHKNTKLFIEVKKEFFKAIKESDLIIDMSGIAYVGDGVRGPLEGLRQYSNFYFARKFKKPFARFIQSFGPFNDWRVRFFAKRELNKLDFVPARGKQSAGYCKSIVKNQTKVFDFPDSAILLPPANDDWANSYLKNIGFKSKEYIVISPSSVIFTIPKSIGGSIGESHVKSMCLVAEEMLKRGNKILFLPHMYSPNKKDCDREICYKIYNEIITNYDKNKIAVVKEDIDPMQAKALIKNSTLAIVSRYHALVAAVSTAVPVVTTGWNVKYQDLLDYYDMGKVAIDVRKYDPEEILTQVVDIIDNYYSKIDIQKLFKNKNEENKVLVKSAFNLLFNWIDRNYVKN